MTGNYGHFLRLVTKCVNTSLRVLNKPKNLWKRPYAQNAFDLSKKKIIQIKKQHGLTWLWPHMLHSWLEQLMSTE